MHNCKLEMHVVHLHDVLMYLPVCVVSIVIGLETCV